MSDCESLKAAHDKLTEAFGEFDTLLRQIDKHLWERWKAGGKDVSNEFVSMYPSATECMEQLDDSDDDDNEE